MSEPELLTVGAAAALVGVSVRTLHHWDQIGLVRPSGRSAAEYRLYAPGDITRIHRVLVYRETGLSLAEVAAILDDPAADEQAHLQRQRAALQARIARLYEMVSAVDAMMEARTMGNALTPQEQAELFGKDWNPEWALEAEQRWGGTEQWRQSQERQAGFTKADWQRIKAGTDALEADLGAAVRAGVLPGSEEANALAERHRSSIGQFYDCTYPMHVCLARMYLADERFTAHYEAVQPGLAQWLHDAICALARARGTDPDTATWE